MIAWIALAVSIASAGFTGLTYLRAGTWISVQGSVDKYQTYIAGPLSWDVLSVTVKNRGLAAAQVTNVFWRVRGDSLANVPVSADAGSLPATVPGQHSEVWTFNLDRVLGDSSEVEMKVGVTLGDGSEVLSRSWLKVSKP